MFDLADDCIRFVTAYFEIIDTSSPHIYHSALPLAPKNSIVRRLYESHAHPFPRVVCGVPTSWDASTVETTRPSDLESVVWSPCNRFIAIAWVGARKVDVLDSATLQPLQTLESPEDISTEYRALIFSPDSRILTCFSGDHTASQDRELYVVSWDLQTGGVITVTRWQGPARDSSGTLFPSIAYSGDGKMVGVCYYGDQDPNYSEGFNIFICNVTSGTLIHSHSLGDTVPLSNHIWTRGESLRFTTADATTITIREVGFISGAAPKEIEALPTPDGFDNERPRFTQLHPTPCRLAFVSQDRIRVWDGQNSRFLLECADAEFGPSMSFSSDGRLFACSTAGSNVYLWKESPDGYILHGILASNAGYGPTPLLAPNGKSIVTFGGRTIKSWRTRSITVPPSSISTQAPQRTENPILDFSPDGMVEDLNSVGMEELPEGYSRESPHGHRVVDGWVLGPDGRRLLLLPPPWQSSTVDRVWKGQSLALLHGGLSETVILEFM